MGKAAHLGQPNVSQGHKAYRASGYGKTKAGRLSFEQYRTKFGSNWPNGNGTTGAQAATPVANASQLTDNELARPNGLWRLNQMGLLRRSESADLNARISGVEIKPIMDEFFAS